MLVFVDDKHVRSLLFIYAVFSFWDPSQYGSGTEESVLFEQVQQWPPLPRLLEEEARGVVRKQAEGGGESNHHGARGSSL